MRGILMRAKMILVAAMLLSGASLCLSQTTLEEYNYVTKGYRAQVENGLDMKTGYRFEDVTESRLMTGDSSYKKTEFKALFRKGEKIPCAILCVYSEVEDGAVQNTDYICIPDLDSSNEIWKMASDKIAEFSGDAAQALTVGIMHLASHYAKR